MFREVDMFGFVFSLAMSQSSALASGALVYGEDVSASVGETGLEVLIRIDATTPIAGFQLDWHYPVTEIEIIEVEKVEDFNWFIVDANASYAPGIARLLAADAPGEHSGVIETFIIRFNVLSTATPGNYNLDIFDQVFSDSQGVLVASSATQNVLTITEGDEDGDGYSLNDTPPDCDDSNANIYPGATEECDGLDNNCDEQIDEGVQSLYYLDLDEDGYGDPNATVEACEMPSGAVSDDSDCDDNDPEINPSAIEIPDDNIDQDCDGNDETSVQDTGVDNELDTGDPVEDEQDDSTSDKESSSCSYVGPDTNVGLFLMGMLIFGTQRRRRLTK
jgi:hypothetical protein